MKISKNKTATMIALFLMFAMTFSLVALPAANAHTPPWEIPSWTYITVAPNPVGVDQDVDVVFWTDRLPHTAEGAYGDRFTFTIEVTKPDDSKETLGPFTSDPVGGGWFSYTPDQVGNYTFVAKFPGHTYTGLPTPPWYTIDEIRGAEYVNDTYLASDSEPYSLTVQEETISNLPVTPLPTSYWTRPINAYNKEWFEIAGNWVGGGFPSGKFNPYTTAPGSAHIVWTRPYWLGGVVGAELGDVSYYGGSSYESFWGGGDQIIIQGRLYYNVRTPPRIGWYCIDLRTGEELWFQNATGPLLPTSYGGGGTVGSGGYPMLSFGQTLRIDNPDQHGGLAYLWSNYNDPVNGTTIWQMYDAFTGNWICNINEVPSGLSAIDQIGSRLIYTYDSTNGWLSLWNSTRAIWYEALAYLGNNYWTWRPFLGKTFNASNGYQWNVTVPTHLPMYSRDRAFVVSTDGIPEMLLVSSGCIDRYMTTDPFTMYAINLKPGQEGQLLWKQDESLPIANVTINAGYGIGIDTENRVFCLPVKETCQLMGYSLDDGKEIWGPTEPEPSMNMYRMYPTAAYGKFFTCGFSGSVHAYDSKTGELLWEWFDDAAGLDAAYVNYPIQELSIGGGKVFASTGEHSETQPLYKGWKMYCIDAETGEGLWNITRLGDYGDAPAIADGYAVTINLMDNQIYCFGKGQTATTVVASPKVSVHGNSVLIEGSVTDQSSGAKGTPAIADEYMTQWMEYLYQQHAMPTDAKGVEVVLETLDPNGNFYEIGRTTSDASGMYKLMFTPEVPGEYTIIATFEGSESYWPSQAETAIGVAEAPQASAAPTPPPPSIADIYVVPGIIGIIVAIVVVGLVIILMLRKR